jgi:hypothetical protein
MVIPFQETVKDAPSLEVICMLVPLPFTPGAVANPDSEKYGFQPSLGLGKDKVSRKGE